MKVNEIINEAPSFIQGLKNFSLKDFGQHIAGKDVSAEPNQTSSKITVQQTYQAFIDALKKSNVPLTIEAVNQYLPSWTQRYILAGHDKDDQQAIAKAIQANTNNPNLKLATQATPQQLPSVINDYLSGMIQLRNSAISAAEKEQTLPGNIRPVLKDVPPGFRAEVVSPLTKGKYFKTGTQWTNETGDLVTEPQNIAALDQWANKIGQIRKVSQEPVAPMNKRVSRKRGQ